MRMLRINWGSMSELALGGLSRLSLYWPFSWRGLSAIILGVLLAKWCWILFAPHAIYTAAAPERTAGAEADQLFGVAAVADEVSQGVALPNVQLLGVFSASGSKPGFAILKLDNSRQLGVAEGEEVVAGTKLIEVNDDFVLLERAGVQQRVSLERIYAGSPGITREANVPPTRGTPVNRQKNNLAPGMNMANRPHLPHR